MYICTLLFRCTDRVVDRTNQGPNNSALDRTNRNKNKIYRQLA